MTAEIKIRVAVVFGGKSGEHEVSLASARSVMAAMDPAKYEIYPVGISKTGCWLTSGDPMARLMAGDNTPAQTAEGSLITNPPCELVPGTHTERFPGVDVVFPVLHGTFGEDGTVQGLFELAGLPYVGAGVLGSALGLDKVASKAMFVANGLPVAGYSVVLRSRWQDSPDSVVAEVEQRFTYPVFVKPANLGSSVGISKAHDQVELRRGLDLAARYDRKILVEEAVDAREIECAVLGNDAPIASVLGEVVPSNEFYDYRAKYVDDASELYIPADLPDETTRQIQALAVRAYEVLDCAGMARADFFVCRQTGRVYVNELNTIPGFTSISMYPKLWEASGLPYPELIDRLIALAIERFEDKKTSETAYRFDQ
ncbi:MAG: D-alanine--D-alanine ligase family protein [Anaerolineae bacterium]